MPTYPLYTAVLAKIGADAAFYRTDPSRGWMPDLDHLESLITPSTRAIVLIDPNNPTGAVYPTPVRRAVLDLAERHGLVVLADEVYGDVAYDGPVPPLGSLDPDGPIVAFSSLSKAYLAPGLANRLARRRSQPATRRPPRGDEEAGRRTSVQQRPDAVRDRAGAARRSLAPGRVPRRAPRPRRA